MASNGAMALRAEIRFSSMPLTVEVFRLALESQGRRVLVGIWPHHGGWCGSVAHLPMGRVGEVGESMPFQRSVQWRALNAAAAVDRRSE